MAGIVQPTSSAAEEIGVRIPKKELPPSGCRPRSELYKCSLKFEHRAVLVRVISGCDGDERAGGKRTELAEEIISIFLRSSDEIVDERLDEAQLGWLDDIRKGRMHKETGRPFKPNSYE